MFETSVVHERAVARRRYNLLFMSVVAHTLVVAAVVSVSLHTVTLPMHPPNELRVFFAPAPPPPPAGSQQPRAQQPPAAQPHAAAAPRVTTAPAPLVAPQRIPDAIPTVAPSSTPNATAGNGDPNAVSNVIGDPNGDPNSVSSDTPIAAAAPVPETIFHPGGDVRPPLVLHRVEPAYPHSAVAIRLGGTVVLQCIVDKSGSVRDAQVVTSSHPAFNEPALAALRQWRFSPGIFRGKPVETYFELTIRFQSR
jgi:protein TonB